MVNSADDSRLTRRLLLCVVVVPFVARAGLTSGVAPSVTLELEALQGFKRLSDAPEVYPEGVSVRIVAAPPEGRDNTPPDIKDLSLELVSFRPGRVAARHYQPDGDRIIGAGSAKPRAFRARLAGQRQPSVHWMTADPNDPVVLPPGKNWLDVPGTPMASLISQEGRSTVIRGTVLADDTGSYTLRFVLGCVVGQRTQTVATRSFELYFEN